MTTVDRSFCWVRRTWPGYGEAMGETAIISV